jgi:NAD(P)H-flavin reductase
MLSPRERQPLMSAASIDPMLPQLYLVHGVRQETHDTFTLELAPKDGSNGRAFAAGQFNMLYVFGIGEAPISISGDPARHQPLIHTIRAVGTVTKAMRELQCGQVLGLRGPYGTAWPVAQAEGNDVVVVAGGIGLAPLRPAIYQLLANREKYGRIALLYGTRAPRDLLYEKELHEWRGRFDVQVEVTVDSAATDWRGHVGVVTSLFPKVRFDPSNMVALICGPEIMMRFTIQELQQRSVEASNIYITMERNMKCALGFCGHCQFGPTFICKDGPVFAYDRIKPFFEKREI